MSRQGMHRDDKYRVPGKAICRSLYDAYVQGGML